MPEKKKEISEWIVCALIALVIVVVIKNFIGFPTVISGSSMDSTLKDGQRLWVSKIALEFDKYPKKGDIVTFEAPSTLLITKANANLNYPVAEYKDGKKGFFTKIFSSFNLVNETSFIKRVIGLPGDHVVVKNGNVYVNDVRLEENYLDPGTQTMSNDGCFTDVIVPDGHVYVLGDHREVSVDSRCVGCIPIDKIEGKAVFRFWPLNKIGGINKK